MQNDLKGRMSKISQYLGFGILWGLQFNLFGSDALFLMDDSVRASNDPFSLSMLITYMITSFILAIIAHKSDREIHLALPAGLMLIAGLLTIGILPSMTGNLPTCMNVGGILCGLAFSYLIISWYRIYAYGDDTEISKTITLGFLTGTLVMTAISFMPHIPALCVAIILALYALRSLKTMECNSNRRSFAPTDDCKSAKRNPMIILYSLIVLMLFYIAISQMLYLGNHAFSLSNIYMDFVEIAATLVVLFIVKTERFDDNMPGQIVVFVVITALIAGILLLSGFRLASATVASFCTHAARVVCVIAFCTFVSRTRSKAFYVFGIMEGLVSAPTLLAVSISLPLLQSGRDDSLLIVLIVVCLYAAFIMMFVLFKTEYAGSKAAEDTIRRMSEQQNLDYEKYNAMLFKKTCDKLSQRFKLSLRERDVLERLVNRKTLPQISEELYLSPNTIKTHTRALYSKMEIHSKNDLIAVFNTTRKETILDTGNIDK